MKIRIDRVNDGVLADLAIHHMPTLGMPCAADPVTVTFDVDDAPDSKGAACLLAELLGDQSGGPWRVELTGYDDDVDGEYRVLGRSLAKVYLWQPEMGVEHGDVPALGDCIALDLYHDSGEIHLP